MTAGTAIIRFRELRELWIHTGTACNLSCPFCHEGSKPGDTRLQSPSLAELAPLLRQAAELGVQRFAFTGGEPLIYKGIGEILQTALELRPVRVLTNGTAPFIRRSQQLSLLRAAPHELSFRVSFDSPDEAVHDAGRGLKNFRKAVEGLRLLHEAGFATGILSQPHAADTRPAIQMRFRQLLRRQGLPDDLPIDWLPELGALDSPSIPAASLPAITHPEVPTNCATGRMVIRRDNRLMLTACPMVDDDPAWDQPVERLTAPGDVRAVHARCGTCLASRVRYGGV